MTSYQISMILWCQMQSWDRQEVIIRCQRTTFKSLARLQMFLIILTYLIQIKNPSYNSWMTHKSILNFLWLIIMMILKIKSHYLLKERVLRCLNKMRNKTKGKNKKRTACRWMMKQVHLQKMDLVILERETLSTIILKLMIYIIITI